MTEEHNRRGQFRRYADRRVAALLELHEILFYDAPGPERDLRFFRSVAEDFQVDRTALLTISEGFPVLRHLTGNWGTLTIGDSLLGDGVKKIVEAHGTFDGALTLSKFRRSSLFQSDEWNALWARDLTEPATAMLSVPVRPRQGTALLWLVLDASSREWSSHDRDLSEEEAHLIGVLLDRGQFAVSL